MTSPQLHWHPLPLRALTMGMLAVCGLSGTARAEDVPSAGGATIAASADPAAAEARRRAMAAAYHLEGVRAREAGRLEDARRAFAAATDRDPGNTIYRSDLAGVVAMLGEARPDPGLAADRVVDELRVRQQQLLIEATAKIDDGGKLLTAGRYAEAERELQMARARLDGLPFADGRREQGLRQVDSLLSEVVARRSAQERADAAGKAQAALDQQRSLRQTELKLERDRIDAMLARAQRARERRDFDEAILLCEQVLKINRAEDRAGSLLVKCRRERHAYLRQITADRWDEEHRLLSENIRTALLPQLEIIRYSSDWPEIDARRGAPVRGGQDGAGNEPWRKNIDSQLEQEVSLDFQEQELAEVVRFLQTVTTANIVLDPKVLAANPPPVTLKVDKMRLRYALDFIMKISGLTYAMKDEAIFISSRDGVRGDVFMKIYDIRDLTHAPKSFPGPEMDIPQPGSTGATLLPPVEAEHKPEANEFIEIIRRVVAPDTWEAGHGADIGEFGGNMVVTQTADVHRQVEELLRALRNQKGTQIHVRCKFLNIENSALEQIGVDWKNFTGPSSSTGVTPVTDANGNVPGTNQPVGGYYGNTANQMALGGSLYNTLPSFTGGNGLSAANGEGMTMNTQFWQVANNFYVSAVINAVEKERKGNIIYEPDITMFNGQQAHLVQMNQQSYVSDYDVVQSQYQPVVAVLAYGTVLDVMAIASADKKYITLTLRPTSTKIRDWRTFGAGETTLNVPSIDYQAVRTSVTIPDGGSLVIGGMTNADSERTHAGVPFLSHIPFLGRLFSSNGKRETHLQTMVVVQADIVLFEEIEKNL